ncbi:hypothetical protein [Allonocardiopsis opalescens]|uniref:Uncharacterized protein n=1 Tax=Allonocardiopsis opalescens TaxID=1144618 RepID=A0A2T0PU62_9ACTN|nr:hypothetical protein [Allonocardiopsis opalescens]PRX92441.1 hypothetical protein CLV72_110201 [Allonocardiopsis opalescens]
MSGRRIELSAAQIVGGGLATLTAAVAASYLGVYGTIAGAAVMSVLSTAGGAVYEHYLKQGGRRARELAAQARRASRQGTPAATAAFTAVSAEPAPPGPEDPERPGEGAELAADEDPAAPSASFWRRHARSLLAGAAVVFIGAMAVIVLVESATGRPLAGTVRGEPGHGTSLWGGELGTTAPTEDPGPAEPTADTTDPPGPADTAPPEPTGEPGTGTAPPEPEPSQPAPPADTTAPPVEPTAPPAEPEPPEDPPADDGAAGEDAAPAG